MRTNAVIYICENAECDEVLIVPLGDMGTAGDQVAELNGWKKAYSDRNLWLCKRHG